MLILDIAAHRNKCDAMLWQFMSEIQTQDTKIYKRNPGLIPYMWPNQSCHYSRDYKGWQGQLHIFQGIASTLPAREIIKKERD